MTPRLSILTILLAGLLAIVAHSAQVRFAWSGGAGADGFTFTLFPCQPGEVASRALVSELEVTNTADIVVPPGTWNAMLIGWSTNNASGVKVFSAPAFYGPVTIPDETRLSVNLSAPYIPPAITLSSNVSAVATVWVRVSTNVVDFSEFVPVAELKLGDGTAATYETMLSIRKP